MRDSKIFIDTNILVYAKIDDGSEKHTQALDFINSNESEIIISAQVLNELFIALYKFFKNDLSTRNALTSLITDCQIAPITLQTSQAAWEIKEKHKFSYWDSLIISSALENECEFLYTEDLQDGQIINSRLTIKNPLNNKV